MDEYIFSIDLEANNLLREKIICTSDLEYDLGHMIFTFDTEII